MKARIKFRKYGVLRFIGHLDVMRFFQKVMRRAQIPIAFTGGFSPHMIMSFASPLGIGLTSDGEYFDIELTEPINSEEAVRRMNAACVEGIEVLSFRQIAEEKKMTGMAILAACDYLAGFKDSTLLDEWNQDIERFLNQPEIPVMKQTKRSVQKTDIRPLIYYMEISGGKMFMRVAAGSVKNLKPELVLNAFLKFTDREVNEENYTRHRLEMYADMADEAEQKQGIHRLITLEALGKDID